MPGLNLDHAPAASPLSTTWLADIQLRQLDSIQQGCAYWYCYTLARGLKSD
jgi:hypothetical protein